MNIKVTAPGKLILSGEHAVLYNQSAIAIAIDKHIQTTIIPAQHNSIAFSLLGTQGELTIEALHTLKHEIDERYHLFLNGALEVKKIIAHPKDLSLYCLADVLFEKDAQPQTGLTITTQSSVPVGCGMGSSAATIVSTLLAAHQFIGNNITPDAITQRAIFIEHYQHGHSSGLDIQTTLQGGCLSLLDNHINAKVPPAFPFYLVYTGAPESTTGECVMSVAKHYEKSSIWDEFKNVTHNIALAIDQLDFSALQSYMKHNHALLNHIGVVPPPVAAFIADIELFGGAAKICGAGGVTGNSAGMVLVATEYLDTLFPVCRQYQFTCEPITIDTVGAHVL